MHTKETIRLEYKSNTYQDKWSVECDRVELIEKTFMETNYKGKGHHLVFTDLTDMAKI